MCDLLSISEQIVNVFYTGYAHARKPLNGMLFLTG